MICRSCKSKSLIEVLSLGDQYLSDFRLDDKKPGKYPLDLMFCETCCFVQLKESAPLSEMYTPNYGFKSGVNNTIREDLASIVREAKTYLKKSPQIEQLDQSHGTYINRPVVIDIGANDGTLLSNYDDSFIKIGIEPIEKLARECMGIADNCINDFWNYKRVERILGESKADIITSISMFYDVEDPDQFVREVAHFLSKDGVWIIQQNYLLTTLEMNAYDNICHEHIGYHSMISMKNLLERHGLMIVDVSTSMINGGAFRIAVQHKGNWQGEPLAVKQQLEKEYSFGLDTIKPYNEFRKRVEDNTKKLVQLIKGIVRHGEKVYIYGASTRGATIWQYAGLDYRHFAAAVDRNPDKVGKKIASIGVPIISEEQARKDHPEYMFVSPWFFKDEFIEREKEYLKSGGHFIFPLPVLEII